MRIEDMTTPQQATNLLYTLYVGQRRALLNKGFAGRQLEYTQGTASNGSGGGSDVLDNDAPWNEPPLNALPFFPKGSIILPAVGAGDTTVISLTVPPGYNGVIKQFSNNFTGGSFVPGSGDIVWRLVRNGAAIRNFDSMIAEYGTVDQPVGVTGIRIYTGDRIDFVVNHVANALLNGNIVCCLEGYFYPIVGN